MQTGVALLAWTWLTALQGIVKERIYLLPTESRRSDSNDYARAAFLQRSLTVQLRPTAGGRRAQK